jgi:hypothetical protein
LAIYSFSGSSKEKILKANYCCEGEIHKYGGNPGKPFHQNLDLLKGEQSMVDGPLTEEEINELLVAAEELMAKIKEGKVLALTELPLSEEVGNNGSMEEKEIDCYPNKRRGRKAVGSTDVKP